MKTEIKMQFDPDVAKEVGTDAAIILSNIEFWISKNRKDEERIEEDKRLHYKDGAYWTYNSVQGWLEYFPYLTHDKIRRSLERLEAKGYIVSGKFNSKNWDQTKWYTSLRHECPIDWALTPNQLGILAQSNGRPSPTNTIYKTTNSKNTDSNLHTYASSADATLAGDYKSESAGQHTNTSSLLSTQEHTYGHSAKSQGTVSILQQVIDIVNPKQKVTQARLRALNARLKDYSVDEVVAAARRFAKDEWRNRPENKKFKSVDYLLAPSKFSRWAEATDEGANEKPKSKSISVKY